MGEFLAAYGPALFWVLVATAAAIIESQTCDLISIWFVPGAVVAMLLAFFDVAFWVQAVVFISISAVTLTLVHTVLKKYMPKKKEHKMNVDAMIGARGIVEEEIDNIREKGSVKVRGLIWTARSANDEVTIPAGSVVTVMQVSGVKLICKVQSTE